MFSSTIITRLGQPIRRFCTESIKFGDPRMPDKLYKTIDLEIKSAEPAVIESYKTFVVTAAKYLGVDVEDVATPKKPHIYRNTLLKSIRGHRKHLVQYEVRTHFTKIKLVNLTGSTADTFLEYIERMLPEGVGMKVTKTALEYLPSHLNPKSIRDAKIVK